MKKLFLSLIFIFFIFFKSSGQCGEFWGLCREVNNTFGTIMNFDRSGNLLYSYDIPAQNEGFDPKGQMIETKDGKLYGMTSRGGKYNFGVLYSWDPHTEIFTKEFDFDGKERGRNPEGKLFGARNGLLYGMTCSGGETDYGILFQWNPTDKTFTKIIDFNGTENGRSPYGALMQSGNGKIYGMTSLGGAFNGGVIFEYDTTNNTIVKIFDFTGAVGNEPHGSLVEKDGKLYGLTSNGGANGDGTIFEFKPEKDSVVVKFSFNFHSSGSTPYGDLYPASNGKFYGTTTNGGGVYCMDSHVLVCFGVLFEWDPETNIYKKKFDFDYNTLHPSTYLTEFQDKIYGLCHLSTMFAYDLSSDTLNYWYIGNETSFGSLTLTSDNHLYGVSSGGKYTFGLLFEFEPENEKNIQVKTYFSIPVNGNHFGDQLLNYDNKSLYGNSDGGGTYNQGIIFEWNVETHTFQKRHEFQGGDKGAYPYGNLLKLNNGSILGRTQSGGINGRGIVYIWNPVTGDFNKIYDITLFQPDQILQDESGNIYMVFISSKIDSGRIYKLNEEAGMFQIVKTGTKTQPVGLLGFYKGIAYGIIEYGGTYDKGFLYSWDPVSDVYTKKIDFFEWINDPLVLTKEGVFYCVSHGVPFRYDPIKNEFKRDFHVPDNLYYSLEGSDGKFYEIKKYQLFKWDPDTDNASYVNYSHDILTEVLPEERLDTLTLDFCQSFSFPGTDYTYIRPGTYRICKEGVDSALYLNLTNKIEKYIKVTACNAYLSPSGKNVWTQSGIYSDTLTTVKGCDSLLTINLTINPQSKQTFALSGCDSVVSADRKFTWKSSGRYYDKLKTSCGCDSTIIYYVTIKQSSHSRINNEACDSYVSPAGFIWTKTGTYKEKIPNSCGCDSIITINLIIDHINTAVIQDRNVLVSADLNAAHQWIDAENNTFIEGETFLTYTPDQTGTYAVIVTQGTCVDTSSAYSVIITGNEEVNFGNVLLYPNPTNGKVTIDLGKVCDEATITVMNSTGMAVQELQIRNSQKGEIVLNIRGMYLVRVKIRNEQIIKRIVRY